MKRENLLLYTEITKIQNKFYEKPLGAGLFNQGILTLNNCQISHNATGAEGGGISNSSSGTITINNCNIFDNVSSSQGGGLYNSNDLYISNTNIFNNSSYGSSNRGGGGIYSDNNSTLTINHSSVISNSAVNSSGGGLYNNNGTLRLNNSTVSNNSAQNDHAGGIYTVGSQDGNSSMLYLNHSTISGNGIHIFDGINEHFHLKNTIISHGENSILCDEDSHLILSFGYNLIESLENCNQNGIEPSDIIGQEPMLAPLAENGGSTLTNALQEGSPAIEAGSCQDIDGNPVTTDQRGYSRPAPLGTTCDIGSFEKELLGASTATPTNTPTATKTPTNTPVSSATPTNTPVSSATRTNTPVSSATRTNTPVSSATRTNTPVSSATRTNTPVSSATRTNTPVLSATRTNTPVSSATRTNTPVSSVSPTNTPISSVSPTNTPLSSVSPTNTPISSVSPTSTPISSVSPTNTPISSVSPTNTPISSVSPTNTPISSVSPTNTPLSSVSPTNTPISSVSPTNTPISSVSPTNTPVSSVSPTDTPSTSATPISTSTATSTSIATVTKIASNTPTPTATISTDNPIASNVTINPSSQQPDSGLLLVPSAGTEISVSYDYDDPNGNPEGETLIRWTRGSQFEQQEQPALNEQQSVPSAITIAEERWCVTVTPHDGQAYGLPVEACAYIERIPNQLPEAEVTIPEYPRNDEPLTLNYSITDPDNQRQTLTAQLRWYRDGTLQPTLNNKDSVDQELTDIAEEWCAVVQPSDGEDYGPLAQSNCTIINPPDNILPVALTPSILPATPTDSDELTLTYLYSDPDSDAAEGATQIRWYRNGQLQPAFNEQRSVEAEFTSPSEIWWATVRPHDGLAYGRYFKTKPFYISADTINTPPSVSNVEIRAARPTVDQNLRLRYSFQDADNDPQGDTIIRWYKDLLHVEQYDGLTVISADETEAGQVWHAVVYPHDGQAYGTDVAAHSVTISEFEPNSAPEVFDLYLSPNNPGAQEKLALRYQYHDENADLENNSQIRWQVDLTPDAAYDDQSVIPAERTTVGEEWCAFVTPYDGEDYGITVASNCVIIQQKAENTPPMAIEAHLMPFRSTSSNNIELHYRYFDAAGDVQGDSIIKWFKNDIQQGQLNDQTVVPASATSPDDVWHATIRPHDGETFGEQVSTPPITINSPPEVLDASIIEAIESQDLMLAYDYNDHNRDPYGEPKIQWHRNGSHQPEYDNQLTIPQQALSAGDRWQATIWAFDGYEYSHKFTTTQIDIEWQLYLPAILSQKMDSPPTATPSPTSTATPTPTPMPAGPYEENNRQETAYGPLISEQAYEASAEDQDDWYYIMLDRTSHIDIEVESYHANGQVGLYQEYFDTNNQPQRRPIANDGRGGSTMAIPNQYYPTQLNDLPPGRYLIRIYTIENYNESDLYRLEVRYE